MEAKYYPLEIEEKWSKIWSERTLDKTNHKNSFSQVIPPPNVCLLYTSDAADEV